VASEVQSFPRIGFERLEHLRGSTRGNPAARLPDAWSAS
jgi:hypothetical protein